MLFWGRHSFITALAVLVVALLCINTPSHARATDSSKKKSSTAVQKKPTKKAAPKKKEAKKEKAKPKKKEAKKPAKKKKAKSDKSAKAAQPEPASDSSVIKIDASDPKAFTKAILLEKQGIEFEMVGNSIKDQAAAVPKIQKPGEFLDFSSMLVPITHEALLGSPYGIRDHRLHRGVDVNVIKDEPVVAALPGHITVSKYNKGGYGHYVIIDHDNGLQTLYGHLSERKVKVGEYVFPGDIVGLAGNTGKSSAAHLHFEIRYKDINIDPATIVNFPKWELQPGVEKVPTKKLIAAHRKMQAKLQKENVYVVKKGDTQQDVATWFNISIEALCRLNNLKKNAPLRVGQKLRGCE